MITFLAALRWLLNPVNLIGASSALLLGLVAGYLEGHSVATDACDARVTAAVIELQNTINSEADTRANAALRAGDAAPQLPVAQFFSLPVFHHAAAPPAPVPPPAAAAPVGAACTRDRADQSRVDRLCARDPACRRDGS